MSVNQIAGFSFPAVLSGRTGQVTSTSSSVAESETNSLSESSVEGGIITAIFQAVLEMGSINFRDGYKMAASSNHTATVPEGNDTAATDPSSASGKGGNLLDALNGFMHSLFDVLQQSGGQQERRRGSLPPVSGDGSMQVGLEQLIRHLSVSSQASAGHAISDGSMTSALGTLEDRYRTLLATMGESGGHNQLGRFLQILVQNLPGTSTTGNVINIHA